MEYIKLHSKNHSCYLSFMFHSVNVGLNWYKLMELLINDISKNPTEFQDK